ncbi:major facilitator superfamily transporter [compost metagenome]
MQQEKDSSRLWSKSFISLTIGSFLLFLNLQMLLSSFPAYVKKEFEAGDLQVSLVTSIFALSAIVSRFLAAALMRKISRNVLLYSGLILATVSTALYILANSVGSLLYLRAAYGVGFGVASTILPTLVSRIIPVSRMGEGIGYFGLSTSLAMSIGPMIGLNVMKQSGFFTLTMIAAVTVVLILPILLLTRSVPPAPSLVPTLSNPSNSSNSSNQPVKTGGKRNAVKAEFNKKLLFPALLNVVLSITYSGLLSFIALFGDFVNLEQVGLFFLFNAITVVIIRPISGRLFDRRGHAAVLIPAGALVAASMLVLSYTTTMPMLVVSALLYGLGFGAIQPTLQAWMLRSSAPEQYGTANSLFYNATDLGVAIGAVILGAISSVTNYAVMYRYSAGFMVLFVIVYVVVHFIVSPRLKSYSVSSDLNNSSSAAVSE